MQTSPASFVPHLIVSDGQEAIAFYQRAFGAELVLQLVEPGGKLAHAEMRVGSALFMLASEYPSLNLTSPRARGGTTVSLSFWVEDVDGLAARAVEAGAVLEKPIVDEFYGDRVARLVDPFGHRWGLHRRIEEVSPEELERRFLAMIGG